MVGVDAADGGDNLAVERLQPRIEISLVAIGRDRLVQKVIAEDRRLVAIMRGERAPQRDRELPVARHIEGEREAGAVVVIDFGLPAGRSVQIDDHAQIGVAAPLHQPVEQIPALAFEAVGAATVAGIARLDKKPPVQRHAHGIETGRFDEADILFRDVAVAEFCPEARRLLRSDQRLDDAGDLRWRALAHELEHVAFGDQPIAEIDPLDGEALALRIGQVRAVGMDEIRRRCAGGAGADDQGEEKRQRACT